MILGAVLKSPIWHFSCTTMNFRNMAQLVGELKDGGMKVEVLRTHKEVREMDRSKD